MARRRLGGHASSSPLPLLSTPAASIVEKKRSKSAPSNSRVVAALLLLLISLACALVVFATCDSCRQHAPYVAWNVIQDISGSSKIKRQCGSPSQRPMRAWMTGSSSSTSKITGSPPPVFVVGCGHSGTTVLIRLLGRHPDVYVYHNLPNLEYSVTPHSFGSSSLDFLFGVVSFRRRDDARFYATARRRNRTTWAVKSPSNVCRLGYIWEHLPHARVIFIVRDGRDVYLSLRERFPRSDPAGDDVLGRWVHDNEVGLAAAEADARVLVVRLEDLLERPDGVLTNVLNHARLPATPAIVSAMLRGDKDSGDREATTGAVIEFLRRNFRSPAQRTHDARRSEQIHGPLHEPKDVRRWPTELTRSDEAVIRGNVDAMHLLRHFGYIEDIEAPWARSGVSAAF